MVLPDSEVSRILVVTAHPDDVDFGAAGTVAGWTDAGIEVTYCVVTDGDAGGFDESVPRSSIAGIRRAEQSAAADVLGVRDVRFLGYPDGRVTVSLDLRRDISRVIRQVRPQRVLTQYAGRNWARIYASHPDHMAVAEATMCAVYPDARNPFAFPELAEAGDEAWTVGEVWVMGHERLDHFVDITERFERKKAALLSHASQLPNVDNLDGMLRGWNGENARLGGLPEGRLAEAFLVVTTG